MWDANTCLTRTLALSSFINRKSFNFLQRPHQVATVWSVKKHILVFYFYIFFLLSRSEFLHVEWVPHCTAHCIIWRKRAPASSAFCSLYWYYYFRSLSAFRMRWIWLKYIFIVCPHSLLLYLCLCVHEAKWRGAYVWILFYLKDIFVFVPLSNMLSTMKIHAVLSSDIYFIIIIISVCLCAQAHGGTTIGFVIVLFHCGMLRSYRLLLLLFSVDFSRRCV